MLFPLFLTFLFQLAIGLLFIFLNSSAKDRLDETEWERERDR